jgi:hypothetical protein
MVCQWTAPGTKTEFLSKVHEDSMLWWVEMSRAGQVDEKADPPLEVELHKGQTEFDTTCQVSSVANITRHISRL